MTFQATGPTEKTTDEGYGSNYSAEYTETTHFKHPKGLPFKHVHRDGRDYEDSYAAEIVTIGDLEIKYFKDSGNWFCREDITIKRNGTEISYIERSHITIKRNGTEISYIERSQGAVDPLKFDTRNREDGQKVFAEIAADFGMDSKRLAKEFARAFWFNSACLALLE